MLAVKAQLESIDELSLLKVRCDVNQLDLAKIGKAFGFAVPPRVNVSVGGGSGGTGRTGKKRQRDEEDGEPEEEWEEIDAVDKEEGDVEEEEHARFRGRSGGRDSYARRKETLGKRKVEKEVFKKGIERKKMKAAGGPQWSK